MNPSKQVRFAEILRRLELAPHASSFEEAFQLLSETIVSVEDDLTTIPNDPVQWQTDGRLYPPQIDNARPVPNRDDITRFRSRGHNTLIAANGAIQIWSKRGELIFQKNGADGQGISLAEFLR